MNNEHPIQISFDSEMGFIIDEEKCQHLCMKILNILNLNNYELSVEFVRSEEIKELNSDYRNRQTPTDVLSFPQLEFETPLEIGSLPKHDGFHKILGDIAICPEVGKANAENIGQGLDREICFLLVHGILHLCGHDHMNLEDETRMLAQQHAIMARLMTDDWQGVIEVQG